jgi:hypothetical protein
VCAHCGGSRWSDVAFADGVVAEVTDIAGARIATVRADDGTVVVARLPIDIVPGGRVTLELHGGAVVAGTERR